MPIMFLISSIAICFLINLILDLKYFSKKPNKHEISESTVTTNDEIMGQIEITGSKLSDIFKILKNDNNKNDISEIQTYLKALINDVSFLKKENEKNTGSEDILLNKLISMTEELSSFKQSIKNNINELSDKFLNNLSNLQNNISKNYLENQDNLEIESKDNETKDDEKYLNSNNEEIDKDFNPENIEFGETPIQNLVENSSNNQENMTIDNFLEENITTETSDNEEFDYEDKEKEEVINEDNNSESDSDLEVNEEDSGIINKSMEEKIELEDEKSEEETENSEAKVDLLLQEIKTETPKIDDYKNEEYNDTIDDMNVDNETKTDTEVYKEDKKEEDLATKIKRLKERLNS